MGDLKALGSEKLQGVEKINRILEISRYNENIPKPVNETSKDQYRITLADGKEYQIVKEKTGYIIKRTISENVAEYIDPMKHRKYYPSYSQALKRLNLMAKETNEIYENEEGISLFEQKKFVLKTPKPATPPPPAPEEEVENVPPPPPAPEAETTPPPPPPSDEEDMAPPPPPSEEEDMAAPPSEDEGDAGQDETVTFKSIQKLVGRLGQKLRTIGADEENKMSSKDIKYVINSVLSALNLDELNEDDKEQIIGKFEGVEDQMGSEEETDMDMSGEEESMMGSEETPPPPPSDEMGEMVEGDDLDNISMIADNLFKEQKVEQILFKYFKKGDSEKKVDRIIKEERKEKIIKRNKFIVSEIKRLSESVVQEVSARKLIQKYPGLKFVGKSNKKNLVFENSALNQFKISPNGEVL